jgi:RND family efflux transporter MFP subunit
MKYLIPLLLPIVCVACSTSQAGDTESADAARLSFVEPAKVEVSTITAQKGSFDLELISNGKLEAQSKAVVPFTVQEQIVSINVYEGQYVSSGQVLGRLDTFSFQKRLSDAVNAYEQAQLDLEDRLLGLGYSIGDTATIPDNILKMAQLRSNFNIAVSSLQEAERNYEQATIKAPISGIVANLYARENNHSSGFQNFCQILDISTMSIVFNVLETELPAIKKGQSVEVFPFALSGQSFKGTVTSINPAIDERGMVRIMACIPNPDGKLLDGMNARVLLKNSVPDCIIIPKEAVLYRQNRKVVFVYKEGKAIWTYVETSHENSTNVAVTDGLEEGMEVIVENNINLAHEAEVVLRNKDSH